MRLGLGGLFAISALALGCNSIVGVTDVKRRPVEIEPSTTNSSKTEPSAQSGGGGASKPADAADGDDDDTTQVETGKEPPPECDGKASCERLVFVTNATFNGSLGGLDGADAKCTDAAKKIDGFAGRKFMAWLSDATIDASSRLVHGTKRYFRTDGKTIADDWDGLVSGKLTNPLLDESAAPLGGGAFDREAWTATSPAGVWNAGGTTCDDWNTDSDQGTASFGESEATNSDWSALGSPVAVASCDKVKHLYCIEL